MRIHVPITLAVAVVALAGCGDADLGAATLPEGPLAGVVVEVDQSETCACCGDWVAHLEEHGARVEVTYVADLAATKAAAGVPDGLGSCHTATVGDYVVEGHVPAAAIVDLLDARPAVAGIALPGMPAGSPGMPGEAEAPLDMAAFDTAGAISTFGTY